MVFESQQHLKYLLHLENSFKIIASDVITFRNSSHLLHNNRYKLRIRWSCVDNQV